MRTINVPMSILFFALLNGCSTSQPSILASEFVKSQLVRASEGGTVTVQASDSATLAGVKVVIPPGALSADTRITIGYGAGAGTTDPWSMSPSPTASLLPQGVQPSGPVVYLGPDGTAFRSLVTVTLPYALPTGGQQSRLAVFALESSGRNYTVENSALQMAGGFVTFQVNGFTQFQPGEYIPPPPDDGGLDDAGCDSGLTSCSDGDGGVLCTDTNSDQANCGSCGHPCTLGFCVGGSCVLDPGVDAGFDDGGLPDSGTVDDAGCSPEHIDAYNGRSPALDLLIVLDTSGGSDENSLLAARALNLVNALSATVDFQIGVTTTDVCASTSSEDGRLLPCPGCKVDGTAPQVITPLDPNAGQDLAALIGGVDAGPDFCDAGGPEFFEAATEAVISNLIYNYNAGFVRAQAAHAILAVSGTATDDTSPGTVATYASGFESLILTESTGLIPFSFNYLSPSGLSPDGGIIYDNGLPPRLAEMMSDVGLDAVDSLQPNWWLEFSDIANWSILQTFPLRAVPEVSTIKFYLDGPPPGHTPSGESPGVQILSMNPNQTVNWTYDAQTNAITVNPSNLTLSSSDSVYIDYLTALACPAGDVCAQFGTDPAACFQLCDPLTQDCPFAPDGEGQGCFYEPSIDSLVCEPGNDAGYESMPCSQNSDCWIGQDCFPLTTDEVDAGFAQACRFFCDLLDGGQDPCPGVSHGGNAVRQCVTVATASGENGTTVTVGACQPYPDAGGN
jgi:hypothetical protein